MKKLLLAMTAMVALGSPAFAQFDLQVTEVSPFGTDFNNAPDDAVEFIEITNFGNTVFQFGIDGDLFFDDQPANADNADPILGVDTIAAGESAIFLNIDFDNDNNTTTDFTPETGAEFFLDQFPTFEGQIGYFNGSGLSSSGADGATLFLTDVGIDPTAGDIISELGFEEGSQVLGQSFQAPINAFATPTPGFVAAAVPEPTTAGILTLLSLLAVGKRRRN